VARFFFVRHWRVAAPINPADGHEWRGKPRVDIVEMAA